MLTAFASQLQLRHSQNNLELLWSALDCITPCDLTLSLLDNVAWQANAHDLCTLSEARHLNGFMHVHFNETLWNPDFPTVHHGILGESTEITTSCASVSIRWRP